MTRKNAIPPHRFLNDQSLAASFQSSAITLTTATRIGFNLSTSGVTDNTGTFSVQFRVYKDVNNYSDWTTLSLDTSPTLSDADTQFLLDVSVPPGQVRLAFTAAGGTPNGTVDCWISGEQE